MNLRALSEPASLETVPAAIARAAAATGVDFAYLLGQAKAESGLNPVAHARTSSASGLFQFIDATWLAVVKQHGAANGLAWAADAVNWVGGRLHVADSATRQQVLSLRQDPRISALMAAAHAADNKMGLEGRLGRAVGAADLALAHFLGLGGATKFLRAMARDPAACAVATVPHAVRANHSVFFTHSGAARSLEEVYHRIAARFDGASTPVSASAASVHYANAAASPAPAYARAAYLMLAELGA